MKQPTLVIMAAGMGSRYGGLKQLDKIGPSGEKIIDYTAYDALRAGFGRIVFIIRRELLDAFHQEVGDEISRFAPIRYVFQELDDLPQGKKAPADRTKPWGTGQAVYCCRNEVSGPFAVVNADDYYGRKAFEQMADFLKNAAPKGGKSQYCMAGYVLENTLTDHGEVSRGVCETSADGLLLRITEHTAIARRGDAAVSQGGALPLNSVVSMNCWGFTDDLFQELEQQFSDFLSQTPSPNNEFYLPSVADRMIREGKADVTVLNTSDRWYGVTYADDKPAVRQALATLTQQGAYPERLWG